MFGDNRSHLAPGVPRDTSHAFGKERGHIHPTVYYVQKLRLCLESILSSAGTCRSWKSTDLLFVRSLGTSGGSEDLEKSNLAKRSTGQSKDIGPNCKQVVALIRSILGQVMSVSFADWVSRTNMDWLHRSHRAEKRRQDRVSHVRSHSSKQSSLEQDGESHKATLQVKNNTKCKNHRNGKPLKKAPRPARRRKSGEARGRPSHIGLVDLRENALQHNRRNTKDRQIR